MQRQKTKDVIGQMALFGDAMTAEDLTLPAASRDPEVRTQNERSGRPEGTVGAVQLPWDFRSSFPEPLEEAIEADRISPDDLAPEAIAAIHAEHAKEALAVLERKRSLTEAVMQNSHPDSGASITTDRQRERLLTRHASEPGVLDTHFDALIDVYAEVFGLDAAEHFRTAIIAWHHGVEVRSVTSGTPASEAIERDDPCYSPGHPWHYYKDGDAVAPCSVEAIPPAEGEPATFGIRLPSNPAKRRAKLVSLRVEAADALSHAERRYQELVARGVDALSPYDRQIAYGGNVDLAWASSIALAYNHVSYGRGKLKHLF